jgi:hypothetical protein
MDAMRLEPPLTPFLEHLRTLHFISDLDFSQKNRGSDQGIDGTLKVRTPKGTSSSGPVTRLLISTLPY